MDEYSLWLQTNVSSARQDNVRAFADDLGDLLAMQQADIEASPTLGLAIWPESARIRFVRAWRELKFPDGYSSDSSSCSDRPQRRPVGVGERARCPARFLQRSRLWPPPARDQRPLPKTSTNLHAERSPASEERASKRSRTSSRGSWGRHFHYSSKRTQLRISRRTRRCPRGLTPRASRAT